MHLSQSHTSFAYIIKTCFLLLQVGFTGNYNEYFGYTTDVDAVVYLMLVNDVIHGLFPEAVTIGEDVCYPFKSLKLCYNLEIMLLLLHLT